MHAQRLFPISTNACGLHSNTRAVLFMMRRISSIFALREDRSGVKLPATLICSILGLCLTTGTAYVAGMPWRLLIGRLRAPRFPHRREASSSVFYVRYGQAFEVVARHAKS